jgi:ribonucleotide monophosphatase NagD (HAD superfamily)
MIGDNPEDDIYGAKSNFKMMTTLQKIHKGVKVGSK